MTDINDALINCDYETTYKTAGHSPKWNAAIIKCTGCPFIYDFLTHKGNAQQLHIVNNPPAGGSVQKVNGSKKI